MSATPIVLTADSVSLIKPGDIVQFRLNENNQTVNKPQPSTSLTSRIGFQDHDENPNIILLCIGVQLPDKNMLSNNIIKSFDNPFKFIAATLSIKDKSVYLIISTNKGHSVIPIIHKHYCIEKIYLYGSTDTKSSSTWSSMSEKISGPYSDPEELCDHIDNDIQIAAKQSMRWNRSFDFFTMLHTQQLENRYSIIKISTDLPHDECIVIFHCTDRILFDVEEALCPLNQFTDVNKCIQFVNEHLQSEIFLIISGNTVPLEFQSIFDFRQIHAIYYFQSNDIKCSSNKKKISGVFNKLDDLAKQLHKDIQFYREQHIHTSRIDMFSTIERKPKVLHQLNDKQITFLTYNLFIDILPQIPLLEFKIEDLIKICDLLFTDKAKETAYYINQLYQEIDEVENVFKDPRFSQIILRLHQLDQLNNLFILQKSLIDIQNHVLKSTEMPKSLTVYLAKIISDNELKMMQSEDDKFISIGIFVLSTKSLLTARTIGRKLVDNGLVSVLFQIEVVEGTRVLEINSNHVIFHLGTVFHLESINHAPDGIWYVKIKPADSQFRTIKEQIKLEIDVPLSWLTFGNYLYFLNQPQKSQTYFDYLLAKLPEGHIDRLSIYNNMAVMYNMDDKEEKKIKAKEAYDKALVYVQSINSDLLMTEDKDQPCILIGTSSETFRQTNFDRSTVLGSIADVYYHNGDYKLAINHYKQALASSNDSQCRFYYQQMIETAIKCVEKI